MAVPTWQQFMAPVLHELLDGTVRRRRELYARVADAVQLTDADRAVMLASGNIQYENRIAWATSYLARVGALERPARGQYLITDTGRKLLADHPDGITQKDLSALLGDPNASHVYYVLKGLEQGGTDAAAEAEPSGGLDPTEQIEQGISRIHTEVAADLLARLHGMDPTFFENAVVKLLVAMGYGGVEAKPTARSNDGGIDAIIDQDHLGLSRVYVQAKRYEPSRAVHRPELQAFVGALTGRADGGVFITTGRFSDGARGYAEDVPTRVILVDGERLASLMIRFGVGVQVKQTVHVVEVDEDFFE